MKAVIWLRTTAVLFILFAAGHTLGFLRFRPSSPEGLAVLSAMNSVHFAVGHATFSYGGFYLGFGLFITLFYLFSAWLAWFLGSMARREIPDARPIAWGLLAVQMVGVVLSWRYFSIAPALLSALAVVCLAAAVFSLRSESVTARLRR